MKKPLFLLSLLLCLCTCLLAACDTAQPTDTTAPDGEAEPTAEETTVPATEAPTEPITPADGSDGKGNSALPLVAGGAVVIGAIAGALTYFFKKKRK